MSNLRGINILYTLESMHQESQCVFKFILTCNGFQCNVKWKHSLQQYTENNPILNIEKNFKCINTHIPTTCLDVHRSFTTFHMWIYII